MYEVNLNGGSPNKMATVDIKLDMTVKAMALQNISPSQQAAPLQVCAICFQFDHTTPTIQGGETTPTSPGVTIRML